MRDFGLKVDGTAPAASGILTADEDNVRFIELETAVSSSGQTLRVAGVDTDLNDQLSEALARYASGGVWYQDTASYANTLVLSTALAFVMPRAYFHGMHVRAVVAFTNSGAAQVNVNNIGLKKILDVDGALLVGGEMIGGYPVELDYDSAADSGAGAFILTPWATILSMIRNVGEGAEVYKGRNGGLHEFRTLTGVNGTTVVVNGDEIEIDGGAAPGGTGEVNYGANVGTGEGLVYRDKTGSVLNFKKLKQGTNVTLTNGANEITIDASVPTGSLPTLAQIAPALMVRQKRLPSTPPPPLVFGQWTKRPLNEQLVNQIAGAAFNAGSGQITLPAGTYRCHFSGNGHKASHHATRLFSLTGAVELGRGNSADAATGGNDPNNTSAGIARFTLAVTAVLELQTYSGYSAAGYMGDLGTGDSLDFHIDGWVEIIKEA